MSTVEEDRSTKLPDQNSTSNLSTESAEIVSESPQPAQETVKKKKRPKNAVTSSGDNKKRPPRTKVTLAAAAPPPQPGDKLTDFFDLPERIRIKILSYLSYKERAQTQLVSRKFRHDIRVRTGLQSRVKETTKHGLVFMRDVIISSIVVGRFQTPLHSAYQIIGRPDSVQELIFEEPISIYQMDAFINRCRRVESIIVAAAPIETVAPSNINSTASPSSGRPRSPIPSNNNSLRTWEAISQYPIRLQQLRELTLILPARRAVFGIQRLLVLFNAPKLEKLAIRIGDPRDRVDSVLIHNRIFLTLHRYKHLSHLLISTTPTAILDTKLPECANMARLQRPSIIELASKLQLKAIVLTETNLSYHVWPAFFSIQHKLEIFQVMHPMSLKMVDEIVNTNAHTLTKIGIHLNLWQKNGRLVPLNMELFKNCVSLEELMVDFGTDKDMREESPDLGIPNVILLRKLPKSLRVLSLRDCAFLTMDLLQMSHIHRKLESIGIVSMANLDDQIGFGVSFRSLLHLLHFPTLNELLLTGIRTNERVNHLIRGLKKLLDSELKSRNGIYMGTKDISKRRWLVGANGSYQFRFFTSWGVSKY